MPRASDVREKSTTQSKAEKRGQLSMRALALTGLALDEIMARRDPVAALVKAYDEDPMAFIDWVMKHAEPKEEQGKGGNTLNFNGLFGLVAKQAAEQPLHPLQPLQVLPAPTDAEYTEVAAPTTTEEEEGW